MTADRRWRCFVAVPIGDDLRGALAHWVERWRRRPDLEGLRWSQPDAWHVTLAFLGDVDPARIERIEAALRGVAVPHGPFERRTGGLGAFPGPSRARVTWYGVSDPDGRLASMAAELGAAFGLDASGPYRPHLTLARARWSPVDLRAWLDDAAPTAPPGALEVRRIELLRSRVGEGPARYETLASVSLDASR